MSVNSAELINVTINGDEKQIRAGHTVLDLLSDLGLQPRLIVVEHNREILDRDRFADTQVRAGDTLELVHFVGGG